MTGSQSSNGYSLSVTNVTQCYMKSGTDQARSLITTLRRTSGPFRLRRDIFINILQNYPISFHSTWRTRHLPFLCLYFFVRVENFEIRACYGIASTSRSEHVTALHVLRDQSVLQDCTHFEIRACYRIARTSRSEHVTGLHVLSKKTQHRRRNDFV